MKDRLRMARALRKYTQKRLADEIHVSRNSINFIEAGTMNPTDRTIEDICRVLRINKEWLLNGTGEMEIQLSREEEIAELVKDMYQADDERKLRLAKTIAGFDEDTMDALVKTLTALYPAVEKEKDGLDN